MFTHEPIPPPPQQWEPIDLGNGDSSEEEVILSSDDDDDDSSDEYRRKGGRKKEKKYDRRRNMSRYVSEQRRGSGGEAVNFPNHLIDTWNTLPVKKEVHIIICYFYLLVH